MTPKTFTYSARCFALFMPGLAMATMALPPSLTASPDGDIPVVKKFSAAWVEQLTQKGSSRLYTPENSHNFDYIGMPIGGIGQGMLYLGGDGKLWRWDIFNSEIPDSIFYESGTNYVSPWQQGVAVPPTNRLRQGFALQTGSTTPRTLDRAGFDQITFNGRYPVAEIQLRDARCPVEVSLQALSPFIPLDTKNSTYPAAILRYTFRNPTSETIPCRLSGWIENANAWKTRHVAAGTMQNAIDLTKTSVALHLTARPETAYRQQADLGSQCLAFLVDQPSELQGRAQIPAPLPGQAPAQTKLAAAKTAQLAFSEAAEGNLLVGEIEASFTLAPGESRTITCLLTWHNPYAIPLPITTDRRRANATRFKDALDVVKTLAPQLDPLIAQTLLWRDTWNDSTLPAWFLDRTFANTSTLASNTFYQLADGRFYGTEGSYSCVGTCTHVYGYAQAIAHLFPAIERDIRERVDFGLGFDPKTGQVGTRGEKKDPFAVDGQCLTLLRAYREHLLSPDDSFLRRHWPQIKSGFAPLFALDAQAEGILSGAQHNTLDSAWYGQIAWISGLYVAALQSGEAMANLMQDSAFSQQCRSRAEKGRALLARDFFKRGYFVNRVDPTKPETTNSGTGCAIDQMFGQTWAGLLGLPRVFEKQQARSALSALWRNNFTTDTGAYRKVMKEGRHYALADEAGLIMCTFPDKQWTFAQASGLGKGAYAGYFNECMSGFEYQVATQMLQDGLLTEGLAIVRAIDDRYDGAKRNPWNEVECGNHYARAMASYGVFLAACGFAYDGPQGSITFAPRLSPDRFRAPFTSAEGWGTFEQEASATTLHATLTVKWGSLRLRQLRVQTLPQVKTPQAQVVCRGQAVALRSEVQGETLILTLKEELRIDANEALSVTLK